MSNFKQDNIDFNIQDKFINGEKRQVINGKLTSATNDYAGYNENSNASFLINCVDIDWNGGILPNGDFTDNNNNVTIETTGQLLNLINNMAIKIKALEAQINELNVQLEDY